MDEVPQKMKKYESFLQWKQDQSPDNQELIDELKKLIEKNSAKLLATVKWGQGCWVDNGLPRVFIHTEEDHIQLGFYNGSMLEDPKSLLSGNGKFVRFIKVYSKTDIEPAAYGALIKQAVH